MLRRTPLLDAFEREQIVKSSRNLAVNFRIFQALYEEAVNLGVLPPQDRLEDVYVGIRLAQFHNHRPPAGTDR